MVSPDKLIEQSNKAIKLKKQAKKMVQDFGRDELLAAMAMEGYKKQAQITMLYLLYLLTMGISVVSLVISIIVMGGVFNG